MGVTMGLGLGLCKARFADTPLLVKTFGTDLIAEFDAEDLITLRKSTDGGAPTNNGENVAMWIAHSVYGYYATRGTVSQQPLRVDAGPDGKRWLQFDQGDILTTVTTLAALAGATAFECWVRVKVNVLTSSAVIVEHSHGVTGANGGFLLFTPSGTTWSNLCRGNVGTCQRSKAGADTNIHTIRITCDFTKTSGEPDIFIDGSNAGTTLPANSNNTGTMGNFDLNIGARFGPGNQLNGLIRKLALFKRLLSAGEVTFMDSYMASLP